MGPHRRELVERPGPRHAIRPRYHTRDAVVGVRAGEYGRRDPDAGRDNLETVWELAGSGAISPYVHAELPLSEWRAAFAMMEDRELVGRVIVNPNA